MSAAGFGPADFDVEVYVDEHGSRYVMLFDPDGDAVFMADELEVVPTFVELAAKTPEARELEAALAGIYAALIEPWARPLVEWVNGFVVAFERAAR